MWCQSWVAMTQVRLEVHDDPLGRDPREAHLGGTLTRDRRRVEPAGRTKRLGAQELIDPGRAIPVEESLGPAGAEHRLGAVSDPRRQAFARRPGAAAICRSAHAACTPARSMRRRRSHHRRAADSASRPMSSSPRDRPCPEAEGRPASPCSRRRATGSAGASARSGRSEDPGRHRPSNLRAGATCPAL